MVRRRKRCISSSFASFDAQEAAGHACVQMLVSGDACLQVSGRERGGAFTARPIPSASRACYGRFLCAQNLSCSVQASHEPWFLIIRTGSGRTALSTKEAPSYLMALTPRATCRATCWRQRQRRHRQRPRAALLPSIRGARAPPPPVQRV